MSLNRRHFLKMLGVGSILALSNPLLEAYASTAGPCSCVNILLHGFFFMEFQDDMLLVASPKHQPHQVLFRDSGGALQPLSSLIDLRDALQPGSKTTFPSKILQFSRSDIKLNRPFIDKNNPNQYACFMQLPKPHDIVPLRLGKVADLSPNPGNVANSIKRLCDVNTATVTRLKYFPKTSAPFKTRSFYAEHCHPPKACEVNNTFDAARAVFGKEFDLTIKGVESITLGKDKRSDLPDEIELDDENALEEIRSAASSCPPPLCPPPCPPGKVCIESVEVATCPHFGVGP